MTHNRVSGFHCIYSIIQVVHTEFIKVVLTDYSEFKSLSKMIQEQTAAAVITTQFPRKISQEKREKK